MSIQLQEIKNIYIPKIQQIEYLGSTGTQYIDTEFKHNNNTRFVTLLSFQSVSEWNYPFGAFGDSNKKSIFAFEINDKEILYSYYGYINAKKRFNQKVKLNYLYNIDFNKNTHTINDTSVVHDTSNFSSIYNTFIFASSNYDGAPILTTKVRCYYFQIYDNGTLVRDFIPVRIGTKGYMLDKVSGELYGNSGTGDFVLGQDVGAPLHQIYRNKLVEGEDYMIGEMLKSAGSWLDTKLKNFSTAEYMEIEVKKTPTKAASVFGCEAPSNTNRLILALDYYESKDRFVMYISTNVNSRNNYSQGVVNINFNTKKVTLAGGTYTVSFVPTILQNTFPLFAKKANNGTATIANEAANLCISYFKVDGLIDLKPCKLLRPIPRNLDAQCKSRQTGECGMIDLISGRFYGNVAESGTFSLAWDEWLKDCSIQFNPEATLEYSTSIPNDYVFYGRIEVAKLTAQYTDFGFMQASNNYIILGESTVYAISDWGTNKWATFVVSYSGGYECSLQLNGVTLTTITSSTPYDEAPHIQLHRIMQINKIEHTFYPNESDPTQSHSETWKRFVEEDGRQGLGISDITYKIYAD